MADKEAASLHQTREAAFRFVAFWNLLDEGDVFQGDEPVRHFLEPAGVYTAREHDTNGAFDFDLGAVLDSIELLALFFGVQVDPARHIRPGLQLNIEHLGRFVGKSAGQGDGFAVILFEGVFRACLEVLAELFCGQALFIDNRC